MTAKRILKIALVSTAVCAAIASAVLYVQYVEIKKALMAEMSERVTMIIGHTVIIGDLSLGFSEGIEVRDVIIKNPDGKGILFTAKGIRIDQRTGDLLAGDFNFNSITLQAPELTLVRDSEGHLNISDRLVALLTRKSGKKTSFSIERLKISNGAVRYGSEAHSAIEKISLDAADISSDPTRKATFNLGMLHGGVNRLDVKGWMFTGDELKKFGVEGRSENFRFSIFRVLAGWYGLDVERLSADTNLSATGDMNRFSVETETVSTVGSRFLKVPGRVRISTSLDVKLAERAVVIRKAVLRTADGSSLSLQGSVGNLRDEPQFALDAEIRRFDLSAMNLIKGVELGGMLDAENLHLAGSAKEPAKEVKGRVRLSGMFLRREDANVENITADVNFRGDGLSAQGMATASLVRLAGRSPEQPVAVTLAFDVSRKTGRIDFSSTADLSALRMNVKDGSSLQFDAASVKLDGRFSPGTVKGTFRSEIAGLNAAGMTFKKMMLRSGVSYGADRITFEGLALDTGKLRAGAVLINAVLDKHRQPRSIDGKSISLNWPEKKTAFQAANLSVRVASLEKPAGKAEFSTGEGILAGVPVSDLKGTLSLDTAALVVNVPDCKVAGGLVRLTASMKPSPEHFPATLDFAATDIRLDSFTEAARIFALPVAPQGTLSRLTLALKADSKEMVTGTTMLEGKGVSILRPGDGRKLIAEATVNGTADFGGKDAILKGSFTTGTVTARAEGTVRNVMTADRFVRVQVVQPETQLTEIRNAFWDVFPDKLLYAGLEGSVSSELRLRYGRNRMGAAGEIRLKNCMLEGENREFSIGRINGIVPVNYSREISDQPVAALPAELSELDKVRRAVAASRVNKEASLLTIDSISYGFELLRDLKLWVKQQGTVLTIEKFNATIAGGSLSGVVVVDTAKGVQYRTGIELKDMSLQRLCEGIEPIKGYLSGKVDGVAAFKGEGSNLDTMLGKADFRTYSAKGEHTKISKEFLQKVGGAAVKAYVGNRPFDRGVISLYVLKGDIIFRELEISNTNIFGVRDLSVKVAPLNNRIAIEDLLWAVSTAAQRAAAKNKE